MLYSVFTYIKFLIKSTNQHGVHSPFIFDLVTKCFYDKTEFKDYTKLVNYKKSLLENKAEINITDLGSGSKVTKQKTRKISEIAKNSGTIIKRAKLLFRLVNHFKSSRILELGTSLGIATQAFHLGNPNTSITTVEGCPNLSKFSMENFKKLGLKNIELLTGDFSEHIKSLKQNTYDLIFLDGNHQKEATIQYFEALLQTTHNESIFIFDDIYWSKSMTEAWEIIKQHPKVTVTIDTYSWGLVFFRKEQAKEHFTIRV